MVHFFPTPYKDEILYSVLARYSIRCGVVGHQTIAESLFGKSSARAIFELPFNLNALISNLPVNNTYTPDDLIYNHSLFPFFTAFLPPERVADIKDLMLSDGGSSIYGRTGIIGSRVPLNQYLKFCPECFKEDTEFLGEAYWHRIHQIPLIRACPEHGVLLYDSSVMVRGHNPQEYVEANDDNCIISDIPKCGTDILEKFTTLAKDTETLFNNTFPNQPFIWFAKQYIERFKELGYSNINGKVYWERVIKDFVNFYGEEFLSVVHSNVSEQEQGRWLREVTHIDSKAVHPIRHLLLIRFLGMEVEELFTRELSYKPFGDGPWVCINPAAEHFLQPVVDNLLIKYRLRTKNVNGFFTCSCGYKYLQTIDNGDVGGYADSGRFVKVIEQGDVWKAKVRGLFQEGISIKEIATRMNADIKTVKKHLEVKEHDNEKPDLSDFLCKRKEHRKKWLQIVKDNPDKGRLVLRRLAKYSATWLCKHDREWWEKNSPTPKQAINISPVNWEERDKEILEVVRQTVRKIIESEEKPQRISLRLIATKSGLKSFILQLDKLPLTREYIDSAIETPIDLHRRRIQWAIRKLEERNDDLGVYAIINMIGVGNKYRKQLIEEVKRFLQI